MNKITKYLSDQTGEKITNADLLNYIREKASGDYQNDIPKLKKMTKINHANVPYALYEIHQNEFFEILINKIGATVIKALSFENPLGVFKTENFEHGETLEEIYVGLADEEEFNAKSEESPYKYRDTDIMVFYHDINRERKFVRTIEREWTVKAFKSEESFNEFIDKMFISLLSSDTIAEFEDVKQLISNSLQDIQTADGETIHAPATEFDLNQDNWVVEFNKELIKRSNLMAVPSRNRFENGAKVPNATPIDEQYLIVSADFSAELDSLLANAFNMDKASVLAHKIVIDEFPIVKGEGELQRVRPFAALISKNSLILKDKLLTMVSNFNENTLSYNYFLHHHQLVSYSLIENSHIYYINDIL